LSGARFRLAAIALLLAFAALTVLRRDETPVGSLTDDAYYIEMARSLAAGLGPVVEVGPDVPTGNPGLFPPGFPLLLSPLARAQPEALDALKLVPWLGALALLGLTWRLARDDDAATRLALLACLALNPWVVTWSVRVVSDLPFAALALGALLAARPLSRDRPLSIATMTAVILLTGAAMLVRSIGLAVLLAILATLARRRRWLRAGVLLTGVAVTQAVLWLPGWSAGAAWLSDGYRTQLMAHHRGFGERAAFMAGNLGGYLRELPVVMIPAFGQPLTARLGPAAAALQTMLAVMLLALLLRGAYHRLRDKADDSSALLLWYLGFTTLALANFDGWPSGVQTRLLLPLLPLLWWLVLAAVPAGHRRRGLLAAALLACLAHNGWRVAHPLGAASAVAGRGFVDPGAGADWIADHTAATDIVIATDPLPRHVRLNRPVIALGDPDLARMTAHAARYGARWLLLAPAVHGPPGRLDETGERWREVLQSAGWTPAWSDSLRAVSLYRLPG
jgi:hypothetical protein